MAKEQFRSSGNDNSTTFRQSEHLRSDSHRIMKHGKLQPMPGSQPRLSPIMRWALFLGATIFAAVAFILAVAFFLFLLNKVTYG